MVMNRTEKSELFESLKNTETALNPSLWVKASSNSEVAKINYDLYHNAQYLCELVRLLVFPDKGQL